PKEFLQRQLRLTLAGVYGPPAFLLALLLSGYLRVRWLEHAGPAALSPASETSSGIRLLLVEMLYEVYLTFGVAALWYVLSVASLVHSYRAAEDPTQRNQVKWILLGSVAALGPIGYTLYLAFWEKERFGGGASAWPMFFASLLVTAAYAVS